MTAEVLQLKTSETTHRPAPKKIFRPCDYGLWSAVNNMELQVGTVEAYNKICDWAESLKAKIDAGDGKQVLAMFATDPKFIFPLSERS